MSGAHSSLMTSQPLTYLRGVSSGSEPTPYCRDKCQLLPSLAATLQWQEVQPLPSWDFLALRETGCMLGTASRAGVALEEVLGGKQELSGCWFSKGSSPMN